MARSNLAPYAFVWEKVETKDFLGTIVDFVMKLASVGHNDKRYLLTSKFCGPQGFIIPALGLYTCINHKKYRIRSQFKNIFLILHHLVIVTKGFILRQNCPQGRSATAPGLCIFMKS